MQNILFGENLSFYLDSTGISNRSFAESIEAKETTIRNYRKGRLPQIDVAFKIASSIGFSIEEMMFDNLKEKILSSNQITKQVISTPKNGCRIICQNELNAVKSVVISSEQLTENIINGFSVIGAEVIT